MKSIRSATRAALFGALATALAACAGQAAAPATAPAAATADTSTRQAPPVPLPMRAVEFPPFQQTKLANGLPIIVVEKHDLPIANVSLYIRSGTAADPVERAGLANMTAELLTKGTPKRSARQIAETIERVGGDLSASAGLDFTSVSASVLSEQLPLAFDLLSDVSLHPTFPADELEIARKRALSGLQVELSQPGSLAQRRFLSEIYGEQHPYGFAVLPQTLSAIQRSELERFHQQRYRPDNALLVISGDVTAAQAEELARKYFGGWKNGGAASAQTLPQPAAAGPEHITIVNRPGSVQSNILVGALAIRPDNPDYYPLQVLNKIVGGGTDSRLFSILREQHGWTYGAYSTISRPKDVGYYMASAEVRTEVTDSALAEMLHQLNRIRDERVPAAELDAAKSFLTGSFPLTIQTAGQIASQVARTQLLGLPMSALLEYREKIAAVSADDVQRVAREYIRPNQATIIIVGDASRVLPMVRGIAPAKVVDTEGRAVAAEQLEVKASTAAWDDSRLHPQTLVYDFKVQGNPMGTVTSTLAKEGGVWTAKSAVQSPVMSQESELRFGAGLAPISASQTVVQGPNRVASTLAMEGGRVKGKLSLPEAMGGEKDVDAEVVAGTLLPGMDEYAIQVADLAPGTTLTLPLFNGQTGTVTPLTLTVAGEEQVTVPAGAFAAYRIDATGGPMPMTLWVRKELPHILLKQEYAGMPISIELKAVQ
jgi:zinc protease